jgi:hypothetical protein
VKSLTVTNPGSGYVAAAAVFTNAPGDVTGANAAATPVVSSVVNNVTVSNGGGGYWEAPAVTFTGGTPDSAATATAVVTDGVITAVNMLTHGVNYSSAPTVGWTPAVETPTLTFTTNQFVSSVTIGGTGTGYANGTALVFSTGTAAGTIQVNPAGNVIGTVITNGGSYASAPTISITPPPTWDATKHYSVGDVVVRSGTRYMSKASGNLNQQPPNGTWWTVLVENTLTAVMGSGIVGTSYVDGVAPTVSAAVITKDRFGDAITQTAFTTGDWFTVAYTVTKPVVVVNGSGATVELDITSGNQALTYFGSNSAGTQLRFAYQLTAADIAAATGVTVVSPILLDTGTTIKDAAGNDLVLSFTPPTCTAVAFN